MAWCFSCCRSQSKDSEFEDFKGQKQFKEVFDQCSTPSQPGSLRSSRNGLNYSFGSGNDADLKEPGAEIFTMADLSYATSNWSTSNKIGQGGFGMVYKGKLRDGRFVAIKRGRKDAYAHRLFTEFRTEVEMLSQVCFLFNMFALERALKSIGLLQKESISSKICPQTSLGLHMYDHRMFSTQFISSIENR